MGRVGGSSGLKRRFPSGMTNWRCGMQPDKGLQAGLQFAAFRFEEGVADTVDDR